MKHVMFGIISQPNKVDTLIDSYNPSLDFTLAMSSGSFIGGGQSFACGTSADFDACYFKLYKVGSPTGNIVAKLYAHSGTYGTSSIPTGSALATSANIDVTTIPVTTVTKTKFTFATTYAIVSGTKYVITVEFSGGDGSNTIGPTGLTTSPTHGGNSCYFFDGGAWTAYTPLDFAFEAWGLV